MTARMVRQGTDTTLWASHRQRYVDNLKVALIAAIIAFHGIIGYSEFDWWSYADIREVTLSRTTMIVLFAVAAPVGLFLVPLLFLIAGLLTPPSLQRKGVRRYVRDRLLRLGVPFVVFALLLWPLLEYALFRWLGDAPGLWDYLAAEGSLDTGVLWFVGVLLIFSLAYAGWVGLRPSYPDRQQPGELRAIHLLALSVAVSVAAFGVRLVVPLETDNRFVDLNLSQWPACAALFGLGVITARRGWLVTIPDRLHRHSRNATLAAGGTFGIFVVVGAVTGGVDEPAWSGGWHWPAMVFAVIESTLAVFGSVWLLSLAQRYLKRPLRWANPQISRSAYGAFMLQGLVLIGLALALRTLPLSAELKAIAVAALGIIASFGMAWLLISRVPGITRIL